MRGKFMFGKYNIVQFIYGGIAVFLNEQISPTFKSMYMVLLAVIYFQLALYCLDKLTLSKFVFALIAFANLYWILKYDRLWIDNKFRKKRHVKK